MSTSELGTVRPKYQLPEECVLSVAVEKALECKSARVGWLVVLDSTRLVVIARVGGGVGMR